jgi:hypothetical protein
MWGRESGNLSTSFYGGIMLQTLVQTAGRLFVGCNVIELMRKSPWPPFSKGGISEFLFPPGQAVRQPDRILAGTGSKEGFREICFPIFFPVIPAFLRG